MWRMVALAEARRGFPSSPVAVSAAVALVAAAATVADDAHRCAAFILSLLFSVLRVLVAVPQQAAPHPDRRLSEIGLHDSPAAAAGARFRGPIPSSRSQPAASLQPHQSFVSPVFNLSN
jgi:hypothetical protein